eukprot:CAMPEP_0171452608 /NCGR_PEP_ID=MMETSP0945-20130129/648_1 /TAXON_ID=109269 /ORGANISM="Vaucheria litorea, Strain CCMP2940" /LENGTH=232 /DNA_ID=CAMNT_0011977309 /DNA_START=10 /DNA_END=705 /DNA_ORIENTATION=-
MRLTAEVILGAKVCLNALKDRELDLRGFKIPMIENLGVTQNQFDTIDFSDNEIKKLGNFPLMKRLTTIYITNNFVSQIDREISSKLPNLDCLILTNNKISVLSEVNNLSGCRYLTMASFIENPIAYQQHYRLYVIHNLPSVKYLDFKKVKLEERKRAARLFKSEAGRTMNEDISKQKVATFVPGQPAKVPLTVSQRNKILQMIQTAKTSEEIDRLEKMLDAGIFPKVEEEKE